MQCRYLLRPRELLEARHLESKVTGPPPALKVVAQSDVRGGKQRIAQKRSGDIFLRRDGVGIVSAARERTCGEARYEALQQQQTMEPCMLMYLRHSSTLPHEASEEAVRARLSSCASCQGGGATLHRAIMMPVWHLIYMRRCPEKR